MAGNINVLRSPTREKKIPVGHCPQQSLFPMALDGLASLGDSKWKLSTKVLFNLCKDLFFSPMLSAQSYFHDKNVCVYIHSSPCLT